MHKGLDPETGQTPPPPTPPQIQNKTKKRQKKTQNPF